MKDYPAAHSMDTEWFAVDASGNLAIFDSGEGGAVPESNDRVCQKIPIWHLDNFLLGMSSKNSKYNNYRCIELNIPSAEVAKIRLTSKKLQRGIDRALTNKIDVLSKWLLELTSDEAIAALKLNKIRDNYAVRFAGEPIVVYVKECLVERVQKLLENEQILGGRKIGGYKRGVSSLLGLFVYWHDSSAPIPYTCMETPTVPLCLDDLPKNLQDALSLNRFQDLQFAESKEIQPIEHKRCRTWYGDKRWVDTQGQEHEEHPYYPF